MPVTALRPQLVRRRALPFAGLLGAAALCLACSSTTGGSPASSAGGAISSPAAASGSPSIGIGSLPASPSISLPASGFPSIGAGGGSQFCKDFNNGDLSSLGSSSDPSQAVALWDKLAADAPDDIKSDVQAVDDYLHSAVSGNLSGADPQKLSTAAQHIGTYYATHCTSS